MSGAAGRYAPSPTGALHLGNLRTALLAWLFARSSGRRLLLRVDDLDAARVRPGSAAQQMQDLRALGVTFDGEPLVQSSRTARYAEALEQLRDVTYECFCTRREIVEAASAPHQTVRLYPGTCAPLSAAQRAERRRSRRAALRLRADRAQQSVQDVFSGRVTGVVDDLVLRRNDGVPAYHLATVVDDGEAGVDQVVRGDDLLTAAPSQAELAARGVGPADVVVRLAASLGLAAADETVSLADLVGRFDPDRLPREPWVVG